MTITNRPDLEVEMNYAQRVHVIICNSRDTIQTWRIMRPRANLALRAMQALPPSPRPRTDGHADREADTCVDKGDTGQVLFLVSWSLPSSPFYILFSFAPSPSLSLPFSPLHLTLPYTLPTFHTFILLLHYSSFEQNIHSSVNKPTYIALGTTNVEPTLGNIRMQRLIHSSFKPIHGNTQTWAP